MTDSIKLPPLPEPAAWARKEGWRIDAAIEPKDHSELPLITSAQAINYARAAVALNAPAWIRTADQLPPNTDVDILAMYKSGYSAVTCGADVRELWVDEGDCPFWMPIPSLPAGPEAA